MSRPTVPPRRRLGSGVALAALLGSASLTAAASPVVQAVVSFEGAAVSVPGVHVVVDLPGVHAAVVRGTGETLTRLARTPGVRGLTRDSAVHLTGGDENGSGADGVAAATGIARRGRTGKGVRVAVVDSGVSDTAVLNRASGRLIDAIDSSALGDGGASVTTGTFTDGFGHGTFMASLVAGGRTSGEDGSAVGVAPEATVVDVKVAKADGTTSLSDVVGGLDWVAQHPGSVDVASLSFGYTRPGDGYGADPLTDAVERVRAAGVVMVVSAGNTAGQVSDPGFDPRVITAGAADLSGDSPSVAPFSGSAVVAGVAKPDLVANGTHVLGVLPAGSLIARANPGAKRSGGLWVGSGTSQATAVTSGAVALLLSAFPGATPAQVKASLRDAASPLGGGAAGAGLLRSVKKLTSGPDGQALDGRGDLTGEAGFNASSWSASSWSASSWSASSWSASSWSASSWSASSWSFVLPDPPPAPAP